MHLSGHTAPMCLTHIQGNLLRNRCGLQLPKHRSASLLAAGQASWCSALSSRLPFTGTKGRHTRRMVYTLVKSTLSVAGGVRTTTPGWCFANSGWPSKEERPQQANAP